MSLKYTHREIYTSNKNIKKVISLLWWRITSIIHYYIFISISHLHPKNSQFKFKGDNYEYFYHHHDKTWKSERAIEIPIIYKEVESYKGLKILEVGNVISNYLPFNGDILDKYEIGTQVINEDVVDFNPSYKYDLIISISTLEHVGWDEDHIEPEKISMAINNLTKILKKGGKLIFTCPVGYNPHLDTLLSENKLPLTEKYFLKRISEDNQWIESTWDEVKNAEYHNPYNYANAVLIGIINK